MDITNYVAKLNDLAQKQRLKLKYEEVCSRGPDHNKTFILRAVVNDRPYRCGVGKKKKKAKQMAAKNALECLFDYSPESSLQTEAALSSVTSEDYEFSDINFIGILNHYCQKKGFLVDASLKRTGPSHDPEFYVKLVIYKKDYPLAEGKELKEAKPKAAQLAWPSLQEQSDWDSKSLQTQAAPPKATAEDYGLADISIIKIVNHDCQKNGLRIAHVTVKRTEPSYNPEFYFKMVINKKDYPLADGQNIREPKHPWPSLQEQSDWDNKVAIRSSEDPLARLHRPPFSKIATNFLNACKSKEDMMPNLVIMNDRPAEKTSPQPINSRFLLEYDSIEPLGKGGFGSVFKAKDKLIEKYFAVKIICFNTKALREVKALTDLSHENIVRYFSYWREDTEYQWDSSADSYRSSPSSGSSSATKFLYIQMELCDTETLRVWIDEKNTQNVKKSRRDARRRE